MKVFYDSTNSIPIVYTVDGLRQPLSAGLFSCKYLGDEVRLYWRGIPVVKANYFDIQDESGANYTSIEAFETAIASFFKVSGSGGGTGDSVITITASIGSEGNHTIPLPETLNSADYEITTQARSGTGGNLSPVLSAPDYSTRTINDFEVYTAAACSIVCVIYK
jgi:hypothetical protein